MIVPEESKICVIAVFATLLLSLHCAGAGRNLIRDDFAADECYGGFIGRNDQTCCVLRIAFK